MSKHINIYLIPYLIFSVCGNELIDLHCNDNHTLQKDLPFCLMPDYNKAILPVKNGTLNVTVLVNLQDIIEINDNGKFVRFIMLFSMSWIEPRLTLMLNSSAWGEHHSYSDTNWLDYIWSPDLDMINVKKFVIRRILKEEGRLTLHQDKRFLYEIPVGVKLGCPKFDFDQYPFDQQTCNFTIGSFEYNKKKIRYKGNIIYDPNKQRPLQYSVTEITALKFEEGLIDYKQYYTSIMNGSVQHEKDTYSKFIVRMTFTRLIKPHLFTTYLPSSLLVLSSWLGFLIEPSSVPGRIALTVTLLLCLMTMRLVIYLSYVCNIVNKFMKYSM